MNDTQADSGRRSVRSVVKKMRESPIKNTDISPLRKDEETVMVNLIRRNLDAFEEAGSVLASAFRRIEKLYDTYNQEGSVYLVVRDTNSGASVGGAGLGPLAGLSVTEGIGEIRELVLEPTYRRRGIGALILRNCLEKARDLGYRRIYLETTPQMETAQKLFQRFGFRPVTGRGGKAPTKHGPAGLPCYFMLENLLEAVADA